MLKTQIYTHISYVCHVTITLEMMTICIFQKNSTIWHTITDVSACLSANLYAFNISYNTDYLVDLNV